MIMDADMERVLKSTLESKPKAAWTTFRNTLSFASHRRSKGDTKRFVLT
jgi:hypothetical protein